jgi:D-beta-D-heptose 7-phosphate kinase/D-beta-D-heptose 1-phosphate adenosyltransferase
VALPGNAVLRSSREVLTNAGAVVLSDYGKGTLVDIGGFIEAAGSRNIPVLIDPKGSDFSRYRGATLITPNLHEFETVVGHCENDRVLVERGEALREELELDALLVTRSEWGMSLIRKGLEPVHLTANAREVYDVTGAGDTVIAVLGACLAAGQDLVAATAVANLAASIVVAKLGTAAVYIPELRRAARDMDETERGIMEAESLQEAINDARAHGERIVMTNGCFDILHAGHVSYLEKARALGDRLIVAVNDDASVRRLKGENRPVNSLDHRMHVLSSLQSVDWVVAFSGETPEQLICKLNPDVLVKGGDYRPEDIAGSRCVRDNGGEVVVLDYIEGCSTTRIIEQLKN